LNRSNRERNDMNESLQSALKKLRLSGLIGTLDVRLQEASGNHLSHAEFLELVAVVVQLPGEVLFVRR